MSPCNIALIGLTPKVPKLLFPTSRFAERVGAPVACGAPFGALVAGKPGVAALEESFCELIMSNRWERKRKDGVSQNGLARLN